MDAETRKIHEETIRDFYRRMLEEYVPTCAFGITVAYLVRKLPHYTFLEAETALRTVLGHLHNDKR